MVKFTVGGSVLVVTDAPNWVRVLENGCYGLCAYEEAQGVAIAGTVYNLPGHSISPHGVAAFEMYENGEAFTEWDKQATVFGEIGLTKTREQSDKLGSDWVTYKLGDVILRRDYVQQESPTGTADNPIAWTETVPLIPNAFYVLDGVRKVWTGEAAVGAPWEDARFAVF